MKRGFSWLCYAGLIFCGVLVLSGCPAADTPGTAGTVAGAVVEPIQKGVNEKGIYICGTPSNNNAVVARMLDLINRERGKYELAPVSLNPVLCSIAEDFCCAMIEGRFFPQDHINPLTYEGPYDRASAGGYLFLAVGENLAAAQTTPDEAMRDWMWSPRHRDIILGAQWTEVGIGVRTGGEYGVYWVLEFGNPP